MLADSSSWIDNSQIVVVGVTLISFVVSLALRVFNQRQRSMTVRDQAGGVLYKDNAGKGSPVEVTIGATGVTGSERPSGTAGGGGTISESDVDRLVLAVREKVSGGSKTAMVAAIVALGGVLVTASLNFLKREPTDCVAYVNSLATIQKDFPGREMDLEHLKSLYGDDVLEDCDDPSQILKAPAASLSPTTVANSP
jgi:hypothetical protein